MRVECPKKHYFRLHNLNPVTFYCWLEHQQGGTTVTVPSAFIPTRQVVSENSDADSVILNLLSGCSVRCLPAQLRVVMVALSLY
ncbi:TPA: hypothetical protein ACSTJY_003066 [Serratia fonticola]